MGPWGVVTLCREEVSDFTDVLGGALEETPQTPLFPPTGRAGLGGPHGTVTAASLGRGSHR